MTGTVNFPLLIATLKKWYGENKTRPSPTVEIDGQPAVRKSSLGEMIQAGLTQLVTFAVTAGFEFATGGVDGFNKFVEGLPVELKAPVEALTKQAGELYNDFKEGIDALIPPGSALSDFKDALEGAYGAVKEHLINPIADTAVAARAALTGDATTLSNLQTVYANSSNPLVTVFTNGAATLGTKLYDAFGYLKDWTDELVLGDDFTLKDVLSYVNDAPTKFMATYLGIGEVPSLTNLAGSLVREDLIEKWSKTKEKEAEANLKLRQAAAIKFPDITIDVEGIPTVITNPDIAVLDQTENYKVSSLTQEQKNAIEAQFNSLLTSYETVINELDVIGDEIIDQVKTDQQNIVLITKAQSAIENIGGVANDLNNITDPAQKAIFEKTIKPEFLTDAKKLSPIMNITAGNNPTVPETTA